MAFLTMQEYLEKKKKKNDDLDHAVSYVEYMKQNDIAPIRMTPNLSKDEDKERTWFQKSDGNLLETILGSATDIGENLASGILGMGEKAIDAMAYLAPSIHASQMAQTGQIVPMDTYDKMKEDVKEFTKKDLYDEQEIARKIITNPAKSIGIDAENQSVFGEKSDSLVQSAGQLGATIGLQAVGLPWWLTTGTTSFGGEAETAFKEGANYEEAGGSALITAGAEILTEKLSGGISFGGKTLDDVMLKPLTEKIANKTVKTLTNLGIDAVGEGAEEVVASVISNLGTALYKEESIGELLTSEQAVDEYIESFIGGAVLGGGVSAITTGIEAKKAKPTFTANEQAVIDKEIENRVAEREADGKKLDKKAKSEIEKQVKNDLEKGYINIDTIESTLGGETYNKYKSITEQEETLTKKLEELEKAPNTVGNAKQYEETQKQLEELKNKDEKTQIKEQLSKEVKEMTLTDRLSESYNEKSRRSQAFEADLTKYDAKQQEVIKKATESGILNNTNRTHEFVDMVAKISADKGVSFDFTNNAKLKETGFALEGKTVNGYVKDGNIAVNIDSNKALNTVVGHEITHVLEGTELYTELQNVVKEFATKKGEYQTRYDALAELYKDVDGAVIENEVTADLVGEYLFTDSDFVNRLSVEKPNIFKKIYEEIKYLVKTVTGSKEARELEKVKRAFDKAYKESANTKADGTKFSLSKDNAGNDVNEKVQRWAKNTKAVDENGNLKVLHHGTATGEFTVFDKQKASPEGDWGAGFYLTDNEGDVETNYEDGGPDFDNKVARLAERIEMDEDVDYETAEEMAREQLYKGSYKIDAYIKIENPAIVGETYILDGSDVDEVLLEDYDGDTYAYYDDQIYELVENVAYETNLYGDTGELMSMLMDVVYEGGVEVQDLKNRLNALYLEDSDGNFIVNEVARSILENLGYDGIIDNTVSEKFSSMGLDEDTTHYIVFKPNQIKNISNQNPTDNPDINLSLGEQSAQTGDYRVYGKDIALEKEVVAENAPTTEQVAPVGTELGTVGTELGTDGYAPLTEAEANERDAMQGDRTYQDVPPEVEAPYYGEESPVEVDSPFDERDIKDVGKREQKAYMYENPEVKPFFQQEAEVMLAELRNSIKGEKHFNDQLYYDTNGEQGWFGTKRETSEQIAYLLDNFKYTYKDIEKGLKAIIEDDGKENNAISKRIEFMLDERLREGYTDFTSDYDMPPNQDYIRLLEEKQITDYSDESWNNWLTSLAETEPQDHFRESTNMVEAPVDEMQVLYSLEEQQQEKIAEVDTVVEAEETVDTPELSVNESYNAKLGNYRTALEGYKTAKTTIETAFDTAINKKTAEYNALKRKDTQKATTLLTQIENLKLRKSNNVTNIDSKIARVESIVGNMVQNEAQWKQKKLASRRVDYHKGIVDNFKNVFKSKGFDFDKVLEKAKNKGTFASVDNTPQRFIEKSLGYKEGQILNDLTVNKVAQNESKAIKWLNSYTDKKSGLLAQISKEYGIKPRSKESASAQMYAEGFWVDDDGNFIKYGDAELAQDYPDAKVRENIKRLAKDPRIRKIYDETLDMINASRTRNLYPEIPRRNNYFLHFREMDDTFSKLGIPFNPNDIRLKDLPTDINGMTADLKPGQPYFASAHQRMGYKTTYDLVGGVERYLNSAKNQIYHIDDIQTLRALRNYIADTYGQAKGLESLDSMTEEEAVARIEEVYNSHLSTFAKFLNEEANVLAGKTSLTDRGLEGVIGRRGIQFLDTVNRQVGSNMVGANISSALTNTVSMVQAVAKSNKFDATKAFAQTVSNQIGSIFGKTDGFVENNPMMIRRKGIEKLTKTPWESITDKGYLLMSAIDNVSSEFIARTKFNELTRKGMSEQQAHIEADKWASRLLGDRSLGQQPQLYNSKMLGLLTKFQLEVRNQLDSQFYDTIQEAKVSNEDINNRLVRNMKTSAKVGSTFFQLAVLQHLFGQAFESVAGYNPAFDIVEVLAQMFGFDDDEESEDTPLDNLEQGFLTLLGDLPYTSAFTGGRIPISSALPIEQFITGKDSYGNEKSRAETLLETAPYYVLPTGYGQIKKTTQGLGMFSDEHPVAGSYTDSGNLRFPIEDTPANRVRSAIFGQYASENARDYFDNERKPLKEKQIQEYKDLDIPIREYWNYREGLSEHDKLEDKFDYIASLDLPVEKKNIMINNIVDRKEAVDMTNYDDFESYEEFDFATKNPEKYAFSKAVGGYSAYKTYQEALSDISADKDENGKTINGSRKEKVLNYINGLDADYYEKIILFKSEYNADDTYNEEIIEYLNNRSDISFEEEMEILKGLGFEVDADGNIYW